MRPTGALHLGNYLGALKNWTELQYQYECYFFVADIHALTTGYEDTSELEGNVWEMVIDWLAAGLNPASSTLFIQSRVPEHSELHLLLSMITPLGWLERVPTYKDQQEQLKDKDLATYGFLGYPLLQSSDILLYKAAYVPVGEDQVAHVEITREVARRFNHVYGRERDFEAKVEKALKSLGSRNSTRYKELRRLYQEQGEQSALEKARALLEGNARLTLADRERLLGYLEGTGRSILIEPEALLTATPKVPGLDGRKMSKSYGNTIGLREDPDSVVKKLKAMQTDPARVRRTDPGDPDKCRCGTFTRSTPTPKLATGCNRGAAAPVSAASTARRSCRMRSWSTSSPSASAPVSSWRIATWYARSSPKAARRPATWRARHWRISIRPWE
jgi:tryptophanyl-tRNA synthetase